MRTPPSPEVEREHGHRAGERYARDFTAHYRGWLADRRGFDPAEARDAAYECAHGRLPGDRPCPDWPHSEPCGCWPGEVMKPSRIIPAPEEGATMPKTKNPAPLLVRLIADLDDEIAQLTAARDALKKVAA